MGDFEKWSCRDREKERYGLGDSDIRRWYQRDIDQITHSTGFRKLQYKSQLLSEKDPRSRSRMIHTIEVSRIATEICEKLNVSKELAEAISYAHDIATAPYGHIGNTYLSSKVGRHFSHEQSGALQLMNLSKKRVDIDEVTALIEEIINEKGSKAAMEVEKCPFKLFVSRNTYKRSVCEQVTEYYIHHISPEIIDGVVCHGEGCRAGTLEGQIVQMADNIAYLSQDIEDLLSTKIINSTDFTKYSAKKLEYKKNGKEYEITWDEIDDSESTKYFGSLREAFNKTRGRRVAAFINRYVNYNIQLLEQDKLEFYSSEILNKNIPILQIDKGMAAVIDFVWYFIELQYKDSLISTSDEIQEKKMEELWVILGDERFKEKNKCYQDFITEISASSLFNSFNEEWKRAYFISHLSYSEVDLIIDSFHERNYTFDIDIKEV